MSEATTYGDFRYAFGATGAQYLDPGMIEAQIADKRHQHLAHVAAELPLQRCDHMPALEDTMHEQA